MSEPTKTSLDEKLKKNVEEQLERLLQQLQDIEEYKDDMDNDDYNESIKDTKEQMVELNVTLSKFQSGDMTVVDNLSAMRLALHAAISNAFKTPEIIRLFGQRQPAALRLKLAELDRDHKIQSVNQAQYVTRKTEILTALQKLGENLDPEELSFIQSNSSEELRNFVLVGNMAASEDKLRSLLSEAAHRQ